MSFPCEARRGEAERWARQCCISLSVYILLFAQANDPLPYMGFASLWLQEVWKVATVSNEDRDEDRETSGYKRYYRKADTLTQTCTNRVSPRTFNLHTFILCLWACVFYNRKLVKCLKACRDVWTEDHQWIIKDSSTPSDSSKKKNRPALTEGKYQWAAQLLSSNNRGR